MIIQQTAKKQYAIEQKSYLRVLASGLKLTDAVLKAMKLEKGNAINWGQDNETGKTYICKAETGSVLGGNKTFTNTGLKATLMKLAKGASIISNGVPTEDKITDDTQVKGGLQVRFEVSESPITEGGVDYFEVTFKEAVLDSEEDSEENAKPAKTSKSKAEAKATNDDF